MLQVYVYRGSSWRPQRKLRTEVELRHMSATDLRLSPAKGDKGGSVGIELQASDRGTNGCGAHSTKEMLGDRHVVTG